MKNIQYFELKGFDGELLKDVDNRALDVKTILLNHVGAYPAKTGGDAVRAFALGQKIYSQSGDTLQLEDAEATLLKQILEERPGFSSIVMGQIFKAIDDAK